MIKLSFCIPVYNQVELVKQCIESIIGYKGDDIEIIVNDDGSAQDIEGMVKHFHDYRIRYYRNHENVGHDINIIRAFQNAGGCFAFLLRSRDKMISENIPYILQEIDKNPKAAYITGSAVDDRGEIAIQYNKKLCKKGKDTLAAHDRLFIHPSGSAYRIDMLHLPEMEDLIEKIPDKKHAFVVHTLCRLELSQAGDFCFIRPFIWVYSNTGRAVDQAVNALENRESVYSPRVQLERFQCEMRWCGQMVEESLRMDEYTAIYKRYLEGCTWSYKLRNKDKQMQRHYNYVSVRVHIKRERDAFTAYSRELEKEVLTEEERKQFSAIKRDLMNESRTKGMARYYLLSLIKGLGLTYFMNQVNIRWRYNKRFK